MRGDSSKKLFFSLRCGKSAVMESINIKEYTSGKFFGVFLIKLELKLIKELFVNFDLHILPNGHPSWSKPWS
jgi:hypothetical protein